MSFMGPCGALERLCKLLSVFVYELTEYLHPFNHGFTNFTVLVNEMKVYLRPLVCRFSILDGLVDKLTTY